MPSLADSLLAAGCVRQLERIHGEPVKILSGSDAGKTFVGIVEVEADALLPTELGEDSRGRRMLRFRNGAAPAIASQGQVQTDDGKRWAAVRQTFGGHLTTDFELKEISPRDT